jgi:hypothetical protein
MLRGAERRHSEHRISQGGPVIWLAMTAADWPAETLVTCHGK